MRSGEQVRKQVRVVGQGLVVDVEADTPLLSM